MEQTPRMETVAERQLSEAAMVSLRAAVDALSMGDVVAASARACDAWDSLRTLRDRRG
jgi:hypothetical protein